MAKRKVYLSTYKMGGVFSVGPAHKVYIGQRLRTRDGRLVTVTVSNWFNFMGKIKGKEYTWFDTGNYIGSNYPHPLDIDWKRSRQMEVNRQKRQAKLLTA